MIVLALLLSVLQLFDGWTTYQILVKHGGKELNPIMVALMDLVGSVYGALLIAKAAAIGLVWLLVLLPTVDALTRNLQLEALIVLAAVYIWVAHNNWTVLRRLQAR